jgi:hypothetical protein
MAEFTYPLSKERMLEILEEMSKPQPRQPYTMYMNGKAYNLMFPHRDDIDESCTYFVTFDWPDLQITTKKKKHKKKR